MYVYIYMYLYTYVYIMCRCMYLRQTNQEIATAKRSAEIVATGDNLARAEISPSLWYTYMYIYTGINITFYVLFNCKIT